ncbi:SMP-30/gluconolactonase/LRE family protein [uncultured Enterovirga sp.]|uniref:SMP-30/gluconolactonase/LRE family protein n=1 Tax=uncultured Enterovirga sp. TaxID=2026352 RepID=UPI0035CAAF78
MTVRVFPERPRVAVAANCILGEGPIWDPRSATLYWVDIDGGALWSWQPDGEAEAQRRLVGERVGFVLLTPDPDQLVLGLKTGLARLRVSGGAPEMILSPEPDLPGNRLNDAGVGPDGSVYLGTMNDTERMPTGSFYYWSERGLSRFGGHAIVTNGPTVDPVRGVLYAANTSEGHVYRHAIGPDGRPGPAEDFVTFRPGDGHPDGITVDAESHVWICHFGGSRITRFSPEGEPVLIVPVPTAQVTKLAFGGPDLATAYVTTAARDRDRETDPMAGDLFVFEPGIRGIAAEPVRVGLR